MPLESLLELVETLRKRIDMHGAALRQSEALTRYALIDPLLRELGWDTEDPALVMPEYKLGSGIADYALLGGGKPVMMIEAKRLDVNLQSAASQGITYCITDGIEYFTVTDGRRWEIYETHRPVPINEKMAVSFDLQGMTTAEVCLNALVLWRHGEYAGSLSTGQAPILESAGESTIAPVKPPRDDTMERPLTAFNPQPKSKPSQGSAIIFPDATTSSLSTWKSIPVEVTTWLFLKKHLSDSHCPIQIGKATKRYALNSEPVHSDGKPFGAYQQIETLYLDMNHTFQGHVKNARGIIAHVGLDPSQFKIRLPS